MAIEAKSISKGIARAQKKVEEKNFSIRKNLLEYDEVMDHQRHIFYSQRQSILEATRPGKSEQLIKMIWKMFDDTIAAAARKCLDPNFAAQCVCDWARGQVDCSLEPKHIDIHDVAEIERFIRTSAKEDAVSQIMMTVGEYMDEDTDPKQWDIRGLARWAETRFGSTISQNQLRNMSASEVQQHLVEASEKKVDAVDLRGLEPFLDPDFGRLSLLDWARHRFGIDFTRQQFTEVSNEDMTRALDDNVKQSYREREVAYSVEWILNKTLLSEKADDAYTLDVLVQWVNLKFDLDWTVDNLRNRSVKEVSDELFALNREFVRDGRMDKEVDNAVSQGKDLGAWGEKRFGPAFDREIFDGASDKTVVLKTFGRDMLRRELTALERYVLLQIYDSSWKEHMYAVDLLKEAIGLRGYAEQDPKIAYKREGFKMFQEMMGGIQEKVTTIIFKARLAGDADARSRYNIGAARHAESSNLGFAGGAQTDNDRQAAMKAQGEKKVETIVRDKPKVGRNAPCPCGSGKKSKQCCGKAT
ncbi:MAG: SEC-C metal-binding domain-containing protein [Planctomycetota bacterium]|nr:SEC-C metal-binding domain-containing protein [Planctomycetota bacterium]